MPYGHSKISFRLVLELIFTFEKSAILDVLLLESMLRITLKCLEARERETFDFELSLDL